MKLVLCPINDYVMLEKIVTKKEEKKGVIILPNSTEEVTYTIKSIGENVSAILGVGNEVILSDMHEELPVDKKYGDNLIIVKQDVIIAYAYTRKTNKGETNE